MTRTLLIDTDTASDDAVALIMALRSKAVRVAAITVVAGNVPVAQATSNALYTAELCGADVPVYSGAEGPLRRKLVTADWFHGVDGLGDHGYKPRKAPGGAGSHSGRADRDRSGKCRHRNRHAVRDCSQAISRFLQELAPTGGRFAPHTRHLIPLTGAGLHTG